MSASQALRWEEMSPERKIEILEKTNASRSKGNEPSGLEISVRSVLDVMGIEWECDKKVSGFFPDLYLPEYNLLLEVNGCYWHCCVGCFPHHPDAGRMLKRDRIKIGTYRKAGYICLVIVEHEFTRDPAGTVARVLKEVI
ncbi:MAG: hypothetical protein H0U53_04315 [Actinobacteria bacterium]|nr:hypothetical protein [Actinomycetota bacterium]